MRRRGSVRRAAGHVSVTAGFRVVTKDPLAGGPIELEFFVDNIGSSPLQLAVGGDMARQRPGQFSFTAELDGVALGDPQPGVPDLGGPLGVVPVTSDSPWRQPLLLNDFVRLEDTVAKLVPAGSSRLRVSCQRSLALAASAAAVLRPKGATSIKIALAVDIRRADAELAELAAGLLEAVLHGPAAGRERPLAQLLSMRGAARRQIETLASHGDHAVADRARRALAASGSPRP